MAMLSLTDVELYYDHVFALKGVSVERSEEHTSELQSRP